MTPQRMTGIMCAVLSLATGVFQSLTFGFDWLIQLCAGAFLVFFVSIFKEAPLLKAFQVVALFVIGTTLVFQNDGSTYIGIVVLSVSWWYLYTYGFMIHGAFIKTVAGVTALVVVLAVSTEGDVAAIILRLMMTGVISTAIWINARHLIDRDRILSSIRVKTLERTLKETLDAAIILADEITRRKKNGE